MNKLIIEDDEGRTTVVPLVRDEITIGRKEGNTIRLTERNVSRRHARLLKQNGSVYVEDLASYTGVRVNGVRISALTALKDGDQVQIGDYRLAVRAEAAAPPPDGAAEAAPAAAPAITPEIAGAIDAAMAGSAVEAAATAAAVAAEPPTLPETPVPPAVVAAAAAPAGEPAAAAPAAPAAPAKDAPAVRARIEAVPTMPLKMLGAEDRPTPPPPASGPPARLVIVTTELAGMEFRLDRPSLVVGRTDENDIILNHASISRHHAKILREGERYVAVDLQSANGVRVAGQEHERIDLQAGDVLELGHVKARFVGPWENWIYDPREFAPPSRRGLKMGAAVAGVLAAGTAVLLFQGTRKPDGAETAAASATVAAAAPPPAPVGPPPAQLLADATAAAADESWDKAVTPLDLLLATPSGDAAAVALKPKAAELKRKVDLERRSAEIFADFRKAVSDEDPDDALARYDEIPAESIYKPRATSAVPDVKKLFVATHLALAEKARTEGRCDDSRGEVEKLLKLEPTHKRARDIARTCRPEPRAAIATGGTAHAPAVGAAGPPAAAGRPAPPVRAPAVPRAGASRRVPATTAPVGEPSAGGEAAPASDDDPADLIKQARDAWLHQQCGAAIDLSRRALKLKPSAGEANQIIAVCACTLKDKDTATRAYHKLDERGRGLVRTLCSSKGVELGE